MMKRILAFLMTACFLLTGCGTDTSADNSTASVSADAIFEKLSAELPDYDVQDAAIVTKLLGLDADSVVSTAAGFAKDGGPEMLIILEGKDSDAALKAGERMDYYLTTLQSSAAQYAPEQLELLKQGYIYTKDNYSVMYVGATPDNVKKELAKLLH